MSALVKHLLDLILIILVLELRRVVSQPTPGAPLQSNSHDDDDGGPEWNYRADKGPSQWAAMFPNCAGFSQSPIAIESGATTKRDWAPLELTGYNQTAGKAMVLRNVGHTVVLELGGTTTCKLNGGGLEGSYTADQIHFHWGYSNAQGSEHVLDRRKFPAEMHIVHHSESVLPQSALYAPGGLAVLGVFLQIGKANPAFNEIVNHLDEVRFRNDVYLLDKPLLISALLPERLDQFYRYAGSLTTPPCNEVVTWTVFKQPITISQEQMNAFRQVFETSREAYLRHHEIPLKLRDNFRPHQNLNGREVYRRGF